MYFDVGGKQVFATTGGKAFDNKKPGVIFLHGSALDHTFWGLQLLLEEQQLQLVSLGIQLTLPSHILLQFLQHRHCPLQ